MSPELLKGWLKRRPFLPFRVHLSDQAAYDVRNPDFAMVGLTTLVLGVVRDIESEYFDEPVVLALRHITRVDPIIEPATTG